MLVKMVITDYAIQYQGDFNALYESSETLAEAIVDWVDQSGSLYCERFDFVKSNFSNFQY